MVAAIDDHRQKVPIAACECHRARSDGGEGASAAIGATPERYARRVDVGGIGEAVVAVDPPGRAIDNPTIAVGRVGRDLHHDAAREILKAVVATAVSLNP